MDPLDQAFDAIGATPAVDPLDAALEAASKAPRQEAAAKTPASWSDAPNAVGTGGWRGLSRLAGLPVDTVQNVIDLGKAGIGTAYGAATGKTPPEWTQVSPDRSGVVGSGDWILAQANKTKPTAFMVNPQNPDYEGGYLQNGGSALVGIANPNSKTELVRQFLLAQAGGAAGKAAADATGNPALAVTAALLPQGASHYGAEGVKRAVRGGEEGRRDMQGRMQTLEDAGVTNPTLGLASGNKAVGGLENILASTPGAITVMGNARSGALTGMKNQVAAAADLAAPASRRGSWEAGRAIQSGIDDFSDMFKANQGLLYDALDKYIPSQTPVNVANTKSTLASLNADIPGAPELSKQFRNARIASIESAINSDTAGTPPSVMVPRRGMYYGNQSPVPLPPGSSTDLLPFEAVKKTRTLVGNEMADGSLVSGVSNNKWSPLYGALSEDLRGAAGQAGPQATQAFNRATNYTRAGNDRLELLGPFANKDAPEQSFTALMQTTKENASILQAVKKSLPEGARGQVAGTVIDRLGRVSPGNQNELGDAWSSERFLTNWNTMTPKARAELFSGFPNAGDVNTSVNAVAKAASMMRDNSKLWANPSGTAANLAARATLGAPLLPLLSGHLPNPWIFGGVAGATGGANLLARALTSKDVVKSVASPTLLTTNDVDTLTRAMASRGLLGP